MKVLQLGKFYPIVGGVEKVMYDLMEGLSSDGVQCDMLCTHAAVGEPKAVIRLNDNASIICVKAIAKKFATMISPQMISELHRRCQDYDIIHVHHPDPMAAVALLLSGYQGKVVLHWHSDIQKQKLLLQLYMPLQRWLIRRADVIVGTTPVYLKESPHLATVQDKCVALPIGIEPMRWNEQGVEVIRRRYAGKKIIFSLGRLVHYKGCRYLIDAAQYLPDDVVVLIGGSGPLRDELKEQIADLHLANKVKLLGRVSDDDLPNYFKACDLFCLSSIQKTEAFAIVQLEAMSCGKPIVATKIPGSGVSWVNAEGISGKNVPICDGRALAEAMEQVLNDSKLYERLSAGATNRYQSSFRLEHMISNCKDIYRNVLVSVKS